MRLADRLWHYHLESVAWNLVVVDNDGDPATVAIALGSVEGADKNVLVLRDHEWALLGAAFGMSPRVLIERDEWTVATVDNAPFGVEAIGIRCPLGIVLLTPRREWEWAVTAAEAQIASLIPTTGVGVTPDAWHAMDAAGLLARADLGATEAPASVSGDGDHLPAEVAEVLADAEEE